MKKPIIGINCNYILDEGTTRFFRLDERYVRAVWMAGGTPVLLPHAKGPEEVARVLGSIDGLMLTGGADISSKRWGEPLHPKAKLLQPEKERADFALVRAALNERMPTLAICYGHQLINVIRGGSLHQHIPDLGDGVMAHTNGRGTLSHVVMIVKGSRIHEIMKVTKVDVCSSHHQSIHRTGAGLDLTSFASDGIVEAMEETNGSWVIGVQWHPERTLEMKPHRRLFEVLVEESRRRS